MRIVNLVENTEGKSGCPFEHGLCFYIETSKHKILLDTGASGLFLENAGKLGIDLADVDTMVLSHGHYDHGGGLSLFMEINKKAEIYAKESAKRKYCSLGKNGEPRYIGLSDDVIASERIHWISGSKTLDEEIEIFSDIEQVKSIPSTNKRLKEKVGEELVPDKFVHEQCLVITENGKRVLFSGCAHNGVNNILYSFRKHYKEDPEYCISGFHLMRKDGYSEADVEEIRELAVELLAFDTKFYTCHCTGVEPYEIMLGIMGKEKLSYVHCGDDFSMEL